jgi:hypothetical protein
MSIKYYTHFLLQERCPRSMNGFRGVVEVNRALLQGDFKEAGLTKRQVLEHLIHSRSSAIA